MREKERGKGGVGYISCELDKSRQERRVSSLLAVKRDSFYHFPLLKISHIFFILLWVDVVEKLFSAPRARPVGIPMPSLVVGPERKCSDPTTMCGGEGSWDTTWPCPKGH